MSNNKHQIYTDLKIHLLKNGLTNKEIAKKAGMKPTTFSHRINAISPWTIPEMHSISAVINLPEGEYYRVFILPYLVAHGLAGNDGGCA